LIDMVEKLEREREREIKSAFFSLHCEESEEK
jgi:hypothetical protein